MAGIDRYLQNRNGTYRVRVRIPNELRPILGHDELVESLKTGKITEARKLAPPVIVRFHAKIEAAHPKWVEYVDPFQPTPVWIKGNRMVVSCTPPDAEDRIVRHPDSCCPLNPPIPDKPADERATFAKILATWKLEHPNEATFKRYTGYMDELAEHAGTDNANEITPQHIVAFETSLRKAGKLHPNTISNYLTTFKLLFRFAKRKFMIVVNPMADVKVPAKIESDKTRYEREQVQSIVTEAKNLRFELFLIVVVQAYTGVRISEIANRKTTDLRQRDGIWCLVIPKGKTKSSERFIPLHPAVLKLLLPYRESVSENTAGGCCFRSYRGEARANRRCMRRGNCVDRFVMIWGSRTRRSRQIIDIDIM